MHANSRQSLAAQSALVPRLSTSSPMLSGMAAAIFARRGKNKRAKPLSRAAGRNHSVARSFERLEDRTVLSATFGSALTFGSAGTDVVMDLAVTAADDQVSVGAFSGTVDFAPDAVHADGADTRTAGGASDAFFAKYADDGSLLWARSVQGSVGSTSVVRSVAVDGAGNSYLAGDFSGTIAIGAFTLASGGDRDGFAAKVDANGNVVWATRWGAADKEYAYGVAVDAAGNLLATGTTSKYSDSGSLITTNLQIRKFSPSGVAQWSKQIGKASGGSEIANAVATDASGNVFVTGSFKGKVDFDPSPATKNVTGDANGSAYVLKLTSAGNFGWVSPFLGRTSASYSGGNDLAVDASGSIVVGGYYYGSVDFNPGNAISTLPTFTFTGSGPFTSPGYLAKLNSSGAFVWAQKASGAGAVNNIAIDAAGAIYVTGDFYNSGDFDPGAGSNLLTSNGSSDVYVAKFSSTGAYQWAVAVGGSGLDQAQGIAVDSDGDVHIAGSFRDSVDFNPDPLASDLRTSAGGADGFVLTLLQS